MRWSESAQRWMAWVRFPDRSRRKVERVDRAAAERDLGELLALRAEHSAPDHRRRRQATFAEILDAWFEAGCPNAMPTSRSRHVRVESANTVTTAGFACSPSKTTPLGTLVPRLSPQEFALEDVSGDEWDAFYAALAEE